MNFLLKEGVKKTLVMYLAYNILQFFIGYGCYKDNYCRQQFIDPIADKLPKYYDDFFESKQVSHESKLESIVNMKLIDKTIIEIHEEFPYLRSNE